MSDMRRSVGVWMVAASVAACGGGEETHEPEVSGEAPSEPIPASDEPSPAKGWQAEVFSRIANEEMQFTRQEGRLHAVNRRSNLRGYFEASGARFEARTGGAGEWSLGVRLAGIGRDAVRRTPEAAAPVVGRCDGTNRTTASGDCLRQLEYSHGGQVTEWWRNAPDGLEHGLDVEHAPEGTGELRVEIGFDGELEASLEPGSGEVQFSHQGQSVLSYGGLVARDSTGKVLPSRMEASGDGVALIVNDSDALYPIEIDPLLTVLVTRESDVAGAGFGFEIASGLLDGDTRPDLVVGAPDFDGGQTDEGKVFVYYATSSGSLPSTASWTRESDVASAKFGSSAVVGRLNTDLYAELSVGAPLAGNGKVYVFQGSSSGPLTTGIKELVGTAAGQKFGADLALSNVNNDAHLDLVVGAPGGGKVFTFHGGASAPSTTATKTLSGVVGFGTSVSAGGNVNGDAYQDVIVGCPTCVHSSGAVAGAAIVYKGSLTGLSTTPFYTLQCGFSGDECGSTVVGGGDINADGYSDFALRRKYRDASQTLEGSVMVYLCSATGCFSGVSLIGTQVNADFGAGLVMGDFNRDGFSDVAVGAPAFDNGQTNEGKAWVYVGDALGNLIDSGWSEEANQANARYGASFAVLNDMTADSHVELVVGAPGYSNGQAGEGRVYVYNGSSWKQESDQAGALLGYAVTTAQIGDNVETDVIVGAPYFDGGLADEGKVFAYHGHYGGPSVTASWTTEGNQAGALFGAALGKVPGWPADKLVVGAPGASNGQAGEGRVFVYQGGATLPGTANWTLEANIANQQLGTSVAGGFDANHDGHLDIAAGAPAASNGQTGEGRVYVFRGNATGITTTTPNTFEPNIAGQAFGTSVAVAGDVNLDGDLGSKQDLVIGAPGSAGVLGRAYVYHGSTGGLVLDQTLVSDTVDSRFGQAVAAAGDFNGDGVPDIVVGSPQYPGIAGQTGKIHFYFGAAGNGVPSTPSLQVTGPASTTYFGVALTSIRDLDQDSFDEVAVAAGGGATYVYHGDVASADLRLSVAACATGARSLNEKTLASGDVNSDGFDDLLVGAPYCSNGAGQLEEGRVFLYYGSPLGIRN